MNEMTNTLDLKYCYTCQNNPPLESGTILVNSYCNKCKKDSICPTSIEIHTKNNINPSLLLQRIKEAEEVIEHATFHLNSDLEYKTEYFKKWGKL